MVTGVLHKTRTTATTILNLPGHTTLVGRRDPLAGDIPPTEYTSSSSGQGASGSTEWSSILGSAGSVTMQKIREKKQKDMSAQRTLR